MSVFLPAACQTSNKQNTNEMPADVNGTERGVTKNHLNKIIFDIFENCLHRQQIFFVFRNEHYDSI